MAERGGPLPGEEPLWEDRDMPKRVFTEEVSFKYEGPSVEDGSMDMADYGKALIGYSKAVRAIVNEAAPTVQIPDVRFVRTEKGSFTTFISITADLSVLENLKIFFASDESTAITNAIGIAGGIGVAVTAAVKTVKAIRGRIVAKREANKDGTDTVTFEDGEQVTAPTVIMNITNNNYFREGISEVAEPVRRVEGVDSVEFESTEEESTKITAAEASYFARVESNVEEVSAEHALLEIIRPAFDGGAWRFERIYEDDRVPVVLTAEIADENFLRSVESSSEAFRKGDRISAILETRIPTEPRMRRKYTVLSVRDIIRYDPDHPAPEEDTQQLF